MSASRRDDGAAPRRAGDRARPGRQDPWIPSTRAGDDELGNEAPMASKLAEDEGVDAAVSAGVTAAGESDEEAGTQVPPEYPTGEPLPEIGVDSTFGLGDEEEEEEGGRAAAAAELEADRRRGGVRP